MDRHLDETVAGDFVGAASARLHEDPDACDDRKACGHRHLGAGPVLAGDVLAELDPRDGARDHNVVTGVSFDHHRTRRHTNGEVRSVRIESDDATVVAQEDEGSQVSVEGGQRYLLGDRGQHALRSVDHDRVTVGPDEDEAWFTANGIKRLDVGELVVTFAVDDHLEIAAPQLKVRKCRNVGGDVEWRLGTRTKALIGCGCRHRCTGIRR